MEEEEEEEEESPKVTKKSCNVVFLGHVGLLIFTIICNCFLCISIYIHIFFLDHGKSTTCGHILRMCGLIDERTMEKNNRDAKVKAGEGYTYAFAMDELEEERVRGKTFECGHATFETETKHWEIIDAPGHRQFIPHMIGGASQADVAVLIISARKGEFETGFEREGQTKEHIIIARTVGVHSLIVAISKMDEPTVQWDEERYNDIKKRLTPFLKQAGWNVKEIQWIPISGLVGTNIVTTDTKTCPWYTFDIYLFIFFILKYIIFFSFICL